MQPFAAAINSSRIGCLPPGARRFHSLRDRRIRALMVPYGNSLMEQSAAAADSLKQRAAHRASVVGVFKLGRQGALTTG